MSKHIQFNARCFAALIITLAIEVMIALYVRGGFIRSHLGDILVVIVVYCFIRSFLKPKTNWLPLYIFLFAGAVEAAQYVHLIDHLGLSGVTFIRIIAGATFDINDIACYATGCLFLFLFETISRRHQNTPQQP